MMKKCVFVGLALLAGCASVETYREIGANAGSVAVDIVAAEYGVYSEEGLLLLNIGRRLDHAAILLGRDGPLGAEDVADIRAVLGDLSETNGVQLHDALELLREAENNPEARTRLTVLCEAAAGAIQSGIKWYVMPREGRQ
jgi:hypothetical protein